MLWKPYRLRKKWEFQKTITSGKKISNRQFNIFVAKNEANNCHFGISIPRKIVKKATDRNYYKRQIRSILIQHLKIHNDSCHIAKNHLHSNLVLILRPAYLNQDFAANRESLFKLLTF